MENRKFTAETLKADSMIETILACFKEGETVELKREDGKLVVIGIKRKLKVRCQQ